MRKTWLKSLILLIIISLAQPGLRATHAQGNDCTVRSIQGAVTRSGPSTDFEQAGVLIQGEERDATAAESDSAGQTWWRLTSGEWVREDLVTETEGCDELNSVVMDVSGIGGSICVVTSISGTITRTGPDTAFEPAEELAAGLSARVIAAEASESGYVWWQLDNETWVREDLVAETDGCEQREPEVTAEPPPNGETQCVLVVLAGGANTRAEPTSQSELRAPLAEGTQHISVEGRSDVSGQRWWQLSSGAWVREDLVRESPGCDDFGMRRIENVDATEICVLTALEDGANTRTGPSVTFEPRGALTFGEQVLALSYSLNDADDARWWRLASGAWVSEEAVRESEGCAQLVSVNEQRDSSETCQATSTNGAITRTGPGITFEPRSIIPAGESIEILNRSADMSGYTWWLLASGDWVREDMVTESAGCENDDLSGTLMSEMTVEPQMPIVDSCKITSLNGAVIRSGPSVAYRVTGAIASGESVTATAQTVDSRDTTWWQISDEQWVRGDLVLAESQCRRLSFIEDETTPEAIDENDE